MTVQIIKAARKSYWYADKIGKKYRVKQHPVYKNDYQLIINPLNLLGKKDVKIIKR